MGQYSVLTRQAGNELGLASYYYSINNSEYGKIQLNWAAQYLSQLGPVVTVNFDPTPVNDEQAVITAREQVGDQINSGSPILAGIYQLGLHIGLALGQSAATPQDWQTAAVLCKHGLDEAVQDARQPQYAFLVDAGLDSVIANLSTGIDPNSYNNQITGRINELIGMIDNTLGQQQAVP